MDNRIDAAFDTTQQAAALKALDALAATLPFLHDLSPDERQALNKLGDKSRTFVDQALIVAEHSKVPTPGAPRRHEAQASRRVTASGAPRLAPPRRLGARADAARGASHRARPREVRYNRRRLRRASASPADASYVA